MNEISREVATKNFKEVSDLLRASKDQFALALPKHLDEGRLVRIALTELRKTPKLMECDAKSFVGAVMQSAQLGLEPGSALGHAYLIPYGTEVNLIIGYKGMLDLMRRSGQVKSVQCKAVYSKDVFDVSYGLHQDIKHKPCLEEDRGSITHVYAIVFFKSGGYQFEVMSLNEIKAVQKDAIEVKDKRTGEIKFVKKDSPWLTHFEEMAKKTVLRRLFKLCPVSIEMQRAINLDELADANVSQKNSAEIDYDTIDHDTGEIIKREE